MKSGLNRLLLAVIATGALAATAVATPQSASAESNGGVRIMPLGDSITDGTATPGGYRITLWNQLAAAGSTNDFVGSQFNGPSSLWDHDHEGHPGWRIDQIDANIVAWVMSYQPRTVLLHIGTNDVLQNYNLSSAPTRLATLIDKILNTAPNVHLFVATIIPLSNSSQENAARTFNAQIPSIVQSRANAGKHIVTVDMHAALSTADLADGIHPTAGGYQKMGNTWWAAMQRDPDSYQNGSGSGTCTAGYAVTTSWSGGFIAHVSVKAGSTSIGGWRVTLRLPSGTSIATLWGGTASGSTGTVTVSNTNNNGQLAAGGSTEFVFQGNGTGNGATVSCTAA